MKQVKRYNFFFGFLSKKGGIYNKIYNNLQSTGRWPKSLGPVFILRVTQQTVEVRMLRTPSTWRHGGIGDTPNQRVTIKISM